MKSILKMAACAALSLSVFIACNTDAEGTLYDADQVEYAFTSTLQKQELLPADGNQIVVPVYRNTTKGTSSVELSIEAVSDNAEGLFELATPTVTFEGGATMAEAIVSYEDINRLGAADVYKFALSFDETAASPAKSNSIEVSAQRKLTFNKIGTGVFGTTFFGNEDGSPYLMDIEVEKAEEANVYRLLDVYETGYPLVFSVDDNGSVIVFGDQETGYIHPSYGMVSVRLVDVEKEGNNYNFILKFFVSAGSFGDFPEFIQMPE